MYTAAHLRYRDTLGRQLLLNGSITFKFHRCKTEHWVHVLRYHKTLHATRNWSGQLSDDEQANKRRHGVPYVPTEQMRRPSSSDLATVTTNGGLARPFFGQPHNEALRVVIPVEGSLWTPYCSWMWPCRCSDGDRSATSAARSREPDHVTRQ